jgi:hypothetical protein
MTARQPRLMTPAAMSVARSGARDPVREAQHSRTPGDHRYLCARARDDRSRGLRVEAAGYSETTAAESAER